MSLKIFRSLMAILHVTAYAWLAWGCGSTDVGSRLQTVMSGTFDAEKAKAELKTALDIFMGEDERLALGS